MVKQSYSRLSQSERVALLQGYLLDLSFAVVHSPKDSKEKISQIRTLTQHLLAYPCYEKAIHSTLLAMELADAGRVHDPRWIIQLSRSCNHAYRLFNEFNSESQAA